MSKTLNRIKKILAKANQANVHEAEVAMAMASRLMLEHNITLQQVESHGTPTYITHRISTTNERITAENEVAMRILDSYFDISTSYGRSYIGEKPQVYIDLYGKPESVEIAVQVYEYLLAELKSLWAVYYAERKALGEHSTRSNRKSFMLGIEDGICEKLTLERQHVEQEHGLTIVRDSHLQEQDAATKTTATRSIVVDKDLEVGYHIGKQVNIQKGN